MEKKIADAVKQEIASEVAEMIAAGKKRPHLAAILVGHDGGSETYVAHKVKACEQCGFESTLIRYEADVTEAELLEAIARLTPTTMWTDSLCNCRCRNTSTSRKSLKPSTIARTWTDSSDKCGTAVDWTACFLSATPQGILELLRRYNVPTKGANCVVLGRSNIVGKPVASLMMQKAVPGDATVTVCHSRTHDIKSFTLNADIIIAALGQPGFLTADMVKDGVTVIDVGTTRVLRQKLKAVSA